MEVQQLVGIAASVAAGCMNCLAIHLRAARVAGADEEEIRAALRVRWRPSGASSTVC